MTAIILPKFTFAGIFGCKMNMSFISFQRTNVKVTSSIELSDRLVNKNYVVLSDVSLVQNVKTYVLKRSTFIVTNLIIMKIIALQRISKQSKLLFHEEKKGRRKKNPNKHSFMFFYWSSPTWKRSEFQDCLSTFKNIARRKLKSKVDKS